MPNNQRHRGQHPQDAQLFSSNQHEKLAQAIKDLAWLLSRGYGQNSALKLVCDHFALKERQRLLLMRCVCTWQQQKQRMAKCVPASVLAGKTLYIDGFNLLICIESLLSQGFIFTAMDGTLKDLSSVHKSYKTVEETHAAVLLIGEALQQLGVEAVYWYFDERVSNSGRLKVMLLALAQQYDWRWCVELHHSPDNSLISTNGITVTSDGAVLDRLDSWFNLPKYIMTHFSVSAHTVNLVNSSEGHDDSMLEDCVN